MELCVNYKGNKCSTHTRFSVLKTELIERNGNDKIDSNCILAQLHIIRHSRNQTKIKRERETERKSETLGETWLTFEWLSPSECPNQLIKSSCSVPHAYMHKWTIILQKLKSVVWLLHLWATKVNVFALQHQIWRCSRLYIGRNWPKCHWENQTNHQNLTKQKKKNGKQY